MWGGDQRVLTNYEHFQRYLLQYSIKPHDQPLLPSVIRLIRSFRVIRLMSHIKSLRGIIDALFDSIIPVSNAFTILLLIISVCKL